MLYVKANTRLGHNPRTLNHTRPEQRMERLLAPSSQEQVARKIFVIRVRLDDLVALGSGDNRLAGNGSLPQAHVDMVRPENPATVKALTDKCNEIIRKLSFSHGSYIAGVSRSV